MTDAIDRAVLREPRMDLYLRIRHRAIDNPLELHCLRQAC